MANFGTRDRDVELAHELADRSAAIALSYFGRTVDYEPKDDGTPVSRADLEVEADIISVLERRRPDDAILSEEHGGRRTSGGRRWIIDPIDGTEPFLAGRTWWGTHVALEDEGRIVVAVLTRPAASLRWWAVRGHGTFRGSDDEPWRSHGNVTVSQVATLSDATMSGFFRPDSPLAARIAEGSNWVDIDHDLSVIAGVAEGRLEAVIDPGAGYEWDHAAQQLLVTEAGGSFFDAHGGQRIDTRTGIYTNGKVDTELLPVLAEVGMVPSSSADDVQRGTP
jgi:histidinol-phosphatase